MISVVALWRYPLKSAQGESLQPVDVDRQGVRSDRVWACIDLENGTVGSAKHPGKWGRLLEVAAQVEGRNAPSPSQQQVGGRWRGPRRPTRRSASIWGVRCD